MKSDKSFREFFRSSSSFSVLITVLLIGILLIVVSTFGNGSVEKSEEDILSEICASVEGAGRCRAVITYTEGKDEIFAVAVLCEGADSVFVRERLDKLITSLYGIGSNRIAILKIE